MRDRTAILMLLYPQLSLFSSVNLSWLIFGLLCKIEMNDRKKIKKESTQIWGVGKEQCEGTGLKCLLIVC